MAGRFITFEGGEGAGKSTQIKRLTARLKGLGEKVVSTREPGGSPGADVIRDLLVEGEADRWSPMAEALLNFAARQDHLRRTIKPALNDGAWVLCDRFADSTIAYQGHGHEMGAKIIEDLWDFAIGGFKPDRTIILDLPVEIGLDRAIARGGGEDRYERMGRDFHERIRQGFLDIAAKHPDRCRLIDATGAEDQVAAAIMAALGDLLS